MKKTIIIAGGSQGLGLALAKLALKSGYKVALLSRDTKHLKDAKNELADNDSVSIYPVDLTDSIAIRTTLLEITSTHGSIRALVNCAATWMGKKQVQEFTSDELKKSFDLNFLTAFHPTHALLNERKDISELAIVNIGATASLRGGANTSAFCMAKAALRSLSQSLAKELGPKGIHVAHLVIDGLIDNSRTRILNPGVTDENYINPESIAKSILHVIEQDKSCWTFEWDVRPYNEKW